MTNYRGTYVEVNIRNIRENVSKIIKKYNNYLYYLGVVKADSYGHFDNQVVKAIIDGGCNYLAVSSLEEALIIRQEFKDIPILCLGIIDTKFLNVAIDNNITITVPDYEYVMKIEKELLQKLTVHVKIDTGMNRLGIKTKDDFIRTYNYLRNNDVNIEGIYTHIYAANSKDLTNKQIVKFKEIVNSVDKVKIIHIAQSETLVNYPKFDFANGCRLGIIMYGFTSDKSLNLLSTFKLYSKVIELKVLNPLETVGYNGVYQAKEREKIAVVAIGYADGIIRKNTGRYVYINNVKYQIVGNICMDMLMVKVDDKVKVGDSVLILKDIQHIEEVAKYLDTIPYEVICMIGKRVPRVYID